MATTNTAFAQYSGSDATTAPSAATQGLSLKGLSGFRVIVSADLAQTLSGAGTLKCWLYSATLARWVRSSSFDITVDESAIRDFPSDGDTETIVKTGRVFFQANGVTVSGGSVTVTIEGV